MVGIGYSEIFLLLEQSAPGLLPLAVVLLLCVLRPRELACGGSGYPRPTNEGYGLRLLRGPTRSIPPVSEEQELPRSLRPFAESDRSRSLLPRSCDKHRSLLRSSIHGYAQNDFSHL